MLAQRCINMAFCHPTSDLEAVTYAMFKVELLSVSEVSLSNKALARCYSHLG